MHGRQCTTVTLAYLLTQHDTSLIPRPHTSREEEGSGEYQHNPWARGQRNSRIWKVRYQYSNQQCLLAISQTMTISTSKSLLPTQDKLYLVRRYILVFASVVSISYNLDIPIRLQLCQSHVTIYSRNLEAPITTQVYVCYEIY